MKTIISFFLLLFSINYVSADFNDIQYSWYKSSIINLQAAGIVSWHPDGTFKPDWLITRAEMLTILLTASKTPLRTDITDWCFPDVDVYMWYNKYICTASKLDIAKGFADWTFKPNDTVTDLEALALWFKAFNITPTPVAWVNWYDPYRDFADSNSILAIHNYDLWTKITRWKAAELVENMLRYKLTNAPLSNWSFGCTASWKTLNAKNVIIINWVSREYNLSIPAWYSKDKQYNLVVGLHGRTNSNDMIQNYMWLQPRSTSLGRQNRNIAINQANSIIAYPAWMSVKGWYSWSDYDSVILFDALLTQISENYCIDRDNIFIVWHSLWWWFANKLACVRWEVIKWMTSVWWTNYVGNCTWPVASLIFHNVDDPLVSYNSWKSSEWRRKVINQCWDTATMVTVGSYQCKQWDNCSVWNPVTFCEGYMTYDNDPHWWPKSGWVSILGFFTDLWDSKKLFLN
jgi:polyhydroxybutyrate depolymerase